MDVTKENIILRLIIRVIKNKNNKKIKSKNEFFMGNLLIINNKIKPKIIIKKLIIVIVKRVNFCLFMQDLTCPRQAFLNSREA